MTSATAPLAGRRGWNTGSHGAGPACWQLAADRRPGRCRTGAGCDQGLLALLSRTCLGCGERPTPGLCPYPTRAAPFRRREKQVNKHVTTPAGALWGQDSASLVSHSSAAGPGAWPPNCQGFQHGESQDGQRLCAVETSRPSSEPMVPWTRAFPDTGAQGEATVPGFQRQLGIRWKASLGLFYACVCVSESEPFVCPWGTEGGPGLLELG